MNYYRRYCGDYARDTAHLCLAEHGAYTLLLDAYYSAERPLPASIDLLYRICRAMTAEERRAVDRVAEVYFPVEGEFRHNARADRELGIAQKVIETAKENGKKSQGRPKAEPKKKPAAQPADNQAGFSRVTETEPANNHPPTTNHQPPAPTPSLQPPAEEALRARDPEPDPRMPAASAVCAAALQDLQTKPMGLQEAKLESSGQTPAGHLAAVCVANGIKATAFNPTVIEWVMRGVTVERLKDAIGTAKQRKGDQPVSVAYLNPIVTDAGPKTDGRWAFDEDACREKAKEMGLWPVRSGLDNSWDALRQRIREKLRDEARGSVH